MIIEQTNIKGLYIINNDVHMDNRGTFTRIFCLNELKDILGQRKIVQSNLSMTKDKGTIRGLHLQLGDASEMKIIRCIKGAAYDIAVDLRENSKTFLSWHAEELTEQNNKTIIIPEGFAHGFQTLQDDTELMYMTTSFYNKSAEAGIHYSDTTINIDWPLEVTTISDRDKNLPHYDEYQGSRSNEM